MTTQDWRSTGVTSPIHSLPPFDTSVLLLLHDNTQVVGRFILFEETTAWDGSEEPTHEAWVVPGLEDQEDTVLGWDEVVAWLPLPLGIATTAPPPHHKADVWVTILHIACCSAIVLGYCYPKNPWWLWLSLLTYAASLVLVYWRRSS